MAEPLLFVPTWLISPRVCETVPGIRRALDELRARYEVEIFTWPTILGGPAFPPTWEGGVDALRAAFKPGCHVVVMAESVQALIALANGNVGVRSFVAEGMWTPPATLRALGFEELAQAAVSSYRGRSYQWVRLYMQGASEEEWNEAADLMDADIDWGYLEKLAPSFMALNLVRESPKLKVPTLYLDPAVELVGLAGMTSSFLKFVPDAETDELRLWPARLQSVESGVEFARRIVRFIDGLDRSETVTSRAAT